MKTNCSGWFLSKTTWYTVTAWCRFRFWVEWSWFKLVQMTSRSSRNDRRGKFFGFNTLRVSSSVFEVKILLGLAYLFLDTMGWDTLTLRRPLRKKFRKRWFFDVFKVKESRFFKSDLTDPPQFFYSHLLENTNFSPSIVKTLKKFVLPKRCEKWSISNWIGVFTKLRKLSTLIGWWKLWRNESVEGVTRNLGMSNLNWLNLW